MGGSIIPNRDDICIKEEGQYCRPAHYSYLAGLREGIRMASLYSPDEALEKVNEWLASSEE